MPYQHIRFLTRLSIFLLTIHGAFEGLMVESTARSEDFKDIHFDERSVNAFIVNHTSYHDYEQIKDYLTQLQRQYSDHMKVGHLNHRTFEGLQVQYVKLFGSPGCHKPVILIEAGIHAREWISPAATLFVIEMLLRGNGKDGERNLLDIYDWYFIPVANPDGYAFTFTGAENRLWRKNRRVVDETCIGVDLNRNFNITFGVSGSSDNCSSNIYTGENAFSEPETQNIRDLYNHLKPRVLGYVTVHNYGEMIYVPWGYGNVSRPERHVELDRVADLMVVEMNNTHNSEYIFGRAFDTFDSGISGASEDWALSQNGSIYAYCIELRPYVTPQNEDKLFTLEPTEIIPNGEELLAGLITMAVEMKH